MSELNKMTVAQLAMNLGLALQMAEIDPASDTIVAVMEKFNSLGASQLTIYVEDAGFLCVCADPKMARKFKDALEKIHDELEDELTVQFGVENA